MRQITRQITCQIARCCVTNETNRASGGRQITRAVEVHLDIYTDPDSRRRGHHAGVARAQGDCDARQPHQRFFFEQNFGKFLDLGFEKTSQHGVSGLPNRPNRGSAFVHIACFLIILRQLCVQKHCPYLDGWEVRKFPEMFGEKKALVRTRAVSA